MLFTALRGLRKRPAFKEIIRKERDLGGAHLGSAPAIHALKEPHVVDGLQRQSTADFIDPIDLDHLVELRARLATMDRVVALVAQHDQAVRIERELRISVRIEAVVGHEIKTGSLELPLIAPAARELAPPASLTLRVLGNPLPSLRAIIERGHGFRP